MTPSFQQYRRLKKIPSASYQVVYQNKDDQVTVVAAGVTLHEALAAAEYLKKGAGCLPQRFMINQ